MTNVINFADYAARTATPVEAVKVVEVVKPVAETATKFEIGKTYRTRSICDHNCIFEYTVIARTAKRMTIRNKGGNVSKRGIRISCGVETCSPEGTYSMCPVIDATDC